MSAAMNWSPQPPEWSQEQLSLLPQNITEPPPISLPTLLEKSDSFPRPFPIDSNRCKSLKNTISEEILERNINSSYPILHENVLHLYSQFVLHKRQHGNAVEKSVYKNMDLVQFVDRLLTKRAVMFMGKYDSFILLNGKKGSKNWETIGTSQEKAPLLLKDCLSYEEVKLSAFLSVSSYTYFVNIGDRKNFGVLKTERETIQEEGIIMGLIGPRLIKDEVMDFQELVITKTQNIKEKGYGDVATPTIHQLFARFFDEECLEYDAVVAKKNTERQRYTSLKNGEILDNLVYYKRLIFTMDTFFMEANFRAAQLHTSAFLHVVGIGLGVWKRSPCQTKLFMDSCAQRLKILGRHLHNVSDVYFAYIDHDKCGGYKDGDTIPIEGHPLKGIKIHMGKREPHSKLVGPDAKKFLVVSYAWDGNALPGNEWWNNKLGSSGDSAAASSTQVAELHNPFVNPKVCAANLKVVVEGRVLGMDEYVKIAKRGTKRQLE